MASDVQRLKFLISAMHETLASTVVSKSTAVHIHNLIAMLNEELVEAETREQSDKNLPSMAAD
jgi:hypothetical protein